MHWNVPGGKLEVLDDLLAASRGDRKPACCLAGFGRKPGHEEVSQSALHHRFPDRLAVYARIGMPKKRWAPGLKCWQGS